MKVAIFSPTIDAKDGYGNITYELVHHLHQVDIEPVLFLPKSQQVNTVDLRLPFETQCILPEYVFRIYQKEGWKYFRSVDVSACDIVHSLFAFPYCIPALQSARRHKKPFIMGAQGTHGVRPLTFTPEKWLVKHCYKNAATIQVPSEYTKRMIEKYAKAQYPIQIIHNGVHLNRFLNPHNVDAIHNTYKGKKILLTVGGLWGRKGQDLVLHALAKLKRHDLAYIIVGDGNTKESLQEMSHRLGVDHQVNFVGRKSGEELVAYFQACDIYVHTPRVTGLKFEGFGIVYLEASACGKPIVATDAGGIRDAVLDNKTGLIASDEDIDGIAAHIMTLTDDAVLAKKLGKAGKVYAARHDWKTIADQYITLYERSL